MSDRAVLIILLVYVVVPVSICVALFNAVVHWGLWSLAMFAFGFLAGQILRLWDL